MNHPEYTKERSPYMTIAVFLLLVLLGIIAVYYFWQVSKSNKIDELRSDTARAKAEYQTLAEDQEFRATYVAMKNVANLEAGTITWSTMWQELYSLLPQDTELVALAASKQGKVVANIFTTSLGQMADTLQKLNGSTLFSHVFANSVAVQPSKAGGLGYLTPVSFDYNVTGSGALQDNSKPARPVNP